MNSSHIILGAAAVGLIVNTLAVLGVAWRGGRLLGKMEYTMEGLTHEVTLLRAWREESTSILSRAVTQLDSLERRVERLENED